MSYERLEVEEFGTKLIDSGDLDPVYIALQKMEMPHAQLSRWLIAYWCLYHPGEASYMSEQSGAAFWDKMRVAALNVELSPLGDRWPRAAERRHWRGKNAETSLNSLQAFGDPVEILDMLSGPTRDATPTEAYSLPYKTVHNRAMMFNGFGPWIAFKVADMLERLAIVPIDFDQASCFMFKDPKKAALTLYKKRAGIPDAARVRDEQKAIDEVVAHLRQTFNDKLAPPLYDREIGFQEVETVLCKWKSHMNGHYPLYNDLREIRKGCEEWEPVSTTAQEFNHFLPVVPGGDND